MSTSINSNTNSLQANMYANLRAKNNEKLLAMLASGSRLNNAAADAAGLAIADKLSAQFDGLFQGVRNSNDMIGLIQTADGAVGGINDNLQRVRTLTLQASNDTLSYSDRAIIQKEIDALLQSSDDIAKTTKFNGKNLLDGSANGDGSFVTQSGANAGDTTTVQIGDLTTASLVGSIDVTTEAGRSSALDSIDSAMETVNATRAELGASQNQLVSNVKNNLTTGVNTAAAESQIRDVDFAKESASFNASNLLTQTGSFAQAQASNLMASRVAGLLN